MININRDKTGLIIICSLLIIGLNQGLFVQLVASWHRSESMPMKAACACDPESCMCPPSSGCEHNQPKQEVTKEISTCRLNACGQRVSFHAAWDREVPILVCHSDRLAPYPLLTNLNPLASNLATQLYLTPPDKPPQLHIT